MARIPTGGPVPERAPSVQLRLDASAERADFNEKRDALMKAGKRIGALVSEVPYEPGDTRMRWQDYQQATLIVERGRVIAILEPILSKWKALGGSDWGSPKDEDFATGVGDGRVMEFGIRQHLGGNRALIAYSGVTAAHDVSGGLCDKFEEDGGFKAFGYPISGTVPTVFRDGHINRFRRHFDNEAEAAIIRRRVDGKVWAIYGDIYKYYDFHGGDGSLFGLPKSDEFGAQDPKDVTRRQYFDNGTIIWDPKAGSRLEMKPYHLRFKGFTVVKSNGDGLFDPNVEFYFTISTIPRVLPTEGHVSKKLPQVGAEYAKLRAGRWRHDNVVVYSGSSDGLVLLFTGAERDRGNPDLLAKALEAAVTKVGGAIIGSVLDGILGPAAKVGDKLGEPLAGVVAGEVATAINDAINTGDDMFPPTVVKIDLPTLLEHLITGLASQPTVDADGNPAAPMLHHFSTEIGNEEQRLRLFFAFGEGIE